MPSCARDGEKGCAAANPGREGQLLSQACWAQASPGTSMAVQAILQANMGSLLSTIALVLLELGKVQAAGSRVQLSVHAVSC